MSSENLREEISEYIRRHYCYVGDVYAEFRYRHFSDAEIYQALRDLQIDEKISINKRNVVKYTYKE